MFGWGRGKSFADCLEFAGLFRNTMLDRLCSAFSCPRGVGSCYGIAVLRYHSEGFFTEYDKSLSSESYIFFLSAVLKYGFAFEI